MSDGSPLPIQPLARRYFCRKCRRSHATWLPRCSNAACLNHEGLVTAEALEALVEPSAPPSAVAVPLTAPAAPTVPIETPPVVAASSDPIPHESDPVAVADVIEFPRPRLVIARVPSPDLDDPVEELADIVDADDEELVSLADIPETTIERNPTGLHPLDYVLGGGLVVNAVVLLASPRGIGKTSLTLQMLDGLGHRCLYVTGEETREQIAETARRIGVVSKKIYPLVERRLDKIFARASKLRAQTIAIDSIQKMQCDDVDSRPGTPAQLKECTARLVKYAKDTSTAIWIIGHVTSDGAIAGPKTVEHEVDVVLEMEQGVKFEGNERILRCSGKNRFGPANRVAYFQLSASGFAPVDEDGWDETEL